MSTDPLGGDSTNPQSLNGYAYAVNDPEDMIPIGTFTPSMTASSLNGPAASSLSPVPEPSTMNLQMRVQAARAELQELISDYLGKNSTVNPYGSALDMACQTIGACGPHSPDVATLWLPPLLGVKLPAEDSWYTYFDYHRMGQLQSGAGFFSPSWDADIGLEFFNWLVQASQTATKNEVEQTLANSLLPNPDVATNDSFSWVDPGFPSMDWGLFIGLFGGGGGTPPGQQCGIGGIDPACSL